MKKLLFTLIVGSLAASAGATNVCTDPAGDVAGNPGGGILDLLSVDATNDATNLQLTLSINGDIGATNWGKYVFFIDTGAGGGGTQFPDVVPPTNNANPWARNIAIGNPSRAAEFWIGSWVDGSGGNQLWNFTGVGAPQWNNGGGVPMLITPGAISTVQYTIPLASLGVGVGQKIYLEAGHHLGRLELEPAGTRREQRFLHDRSRAGFDRTPRLRRAGPYSAEALEQPSAHRPVLRRNSAACVDPAQAAFYFGASTRSNGTRNSRRVG
jgi:hypothetical protein